LCSILGWIEGPAAEAADLRGVMNFLIDLMDDEAYAAELMDRCVEVGIAFARAQVEAGADTIGIGDAIASQVDPRTYEKLIQPREKRLVRAIQAMGGYAKLHICGNITHLLPGIADLGTDVLDVDHMVDLAAVRAAVGDRVVITGNLDPVAVVRHGAPEAIREAVRRAYATAGNPYFVNAGCEIPAGTPSENLRALCSPVPFQPS
jgi:MtaA/CmuA family methyltransferase